MRRIFGIIIFAALVGLVGAPVWAAEETDGSDASALSDTQVDQVHQNCKQAQSVLQRLQATDVATRINRGRIYENLLNRLITPFNNRVNVNRLDASNLALATSGITQKFTAFKDDYSAYENSFSRLIAINCEADPRGFYSLLTTTRESRSKVATDITDLNSLIGQYTTAFSDLRRSVNE